MPRILLCEQCAQPVIENDEEFIEVAEEDQFTSRELVHARCWASWDAKGECERCGEPVDLDKDGGHKIGGEVYHVACMAELDAEALEAAQAEKVK